MDSDIGSGHYGVCDFKENKKTGLFNIKDTEQGTNPNEKSEELSFCFGDSIKDVFFNGNRIFSYQGDRPLCRSTGQAVVIEYSDSIILLNTWGSSYCSEINLGEPNEKQFRFLMRISIKDGRYYLFGDDGKHLIEGTMSKDGKSLSFKNDNTVTIISISR